MSAISDIEYLNPSYGNVTSPIQLLNCIMLDEERNKLLTSIIKNHSYCRILCVSSFIEQIKRLESNLSDMDLKVGSHYLSSPHKGDINELDILFVSYRTLRARCVNTRHFNLVILCTPDIYKHVVYDCLTLKNKITIFRIKDSHLDTISYWRDKEEDDNRFIIEYNKIRQKEIEEKRKSALNCSLSFNDKSQHHSSDYRGINSVYTPED